MNRKRRTHHTAQPALGRVEDTEAWAIYCEQMREIHGVEVEPGNPTPDVFHRETSEATQEATK